MQSDILETQIIFDERKEDYSRYQYTVRLHEWSEVHLKIQLLFDNPELFSTTFSMDSLYFTIKHPEMFRSKETFMTPNKEENKLVAPASIPKQLPVGFTDEDVKAVASGAMQSIIYGQLLGAIFIKSAI